MSQSEYESFGVVSSQPDVADSLGSTVIVGCQRCGETDSRTYTVIDGKDYCRECAAIVRLEEFHQRVAGDQ